MSNKMVVNVPESLEEKKEMKLMVGESSADECGHHVAIAQNNQNSQKQKEKKKKKKKKHGGSKRKMNAEQSVAFKSVCNWVFLSFSQSHTQCSASLSVDDDFVAQKTVWRGGEKLVFELHTHSKFSDGFLSPTKLVQRAHSRGVKVLALTDHDTFSGIPEALEAARRCNIKIIPGVEISTVYTSRGNSSLGESVHILAYYGSSGPTRYEELEKLLTKIRDGRFLRARNMISKLNKLKLPLKWENVARIAGKDVAPGRLHVARAMVEAGHVENIKQAFTWYLFDGGPAYSTGSEPEAEDAVRLICDTGGVAVLAHPWALKNPITVIRKLKDAGLHGLEVYRSDGKLAAYSDFAETFGLLKLGGSDFHGKGGQNESDLGSVQLPVSALNDFLKVARPIWCQAMGDILQRCADDPSDANLAMLTRFGRIRTPKGAQPLSSGEDLFDCCLSSWLTVEERQNAEFEAIRTKFSNISLKQGSLSLYPESR